MCNLPNAGLAASGGTIAPARCSHIAQNWMVAAHPGTGDHLLNDRLLMPFAYNFNFAHTADPAHWDILVPGLSVLCPLPKFFGSIR